MRATAAGQPSRSERAEQSSAKQQTKREPNETDSRSQDSNRERRGRRTPPTKTKRARKQERRRTPREEERRRAGGMFGSLVELLPRTTSSRTQRREFDSNSTRTFVSHTHTPTSQRPHHTHTHNTQTMSGLRALASTFGARWRAAWRLEHLAAPVATRPVWRFDTPSALDAWAVQSDADLGGATRCATRAALVIRFDAGAPRV